MRQDAAGECIVVQLELLPQLHNGLVPANGSMGCAALRGAALVSVLLSLAFFFDSMTHSPGDENYEPDQIWL